MARVADVRVWSIVLGLASACGSDGAPSAAGSDASPSTDGAVPVDASSSDTLDGAVDGAVEEDASSVATTCTSDDLVAQRECSADRACDYSVDGDEIRFVCRPVTVGAAPGDACDSRAQCARGATCFPFDDSGRGVCREYCAGPCPGAGASCQSLTLVTSGGESVVGRICTEPCDPVTGGGCVDGAVCGLWADATTGSAYTGCRAARGAELGAACDEAETCLSGACIAGRCQSLCEIGAGGCSEGSRCRGFDPPVVFEAREIGFCFPVG